MSDDLIFKIIGFGSLIFSVILHEIAHAYAALRCGDPTARDAGRITLNPIPHIDLVGTIILPAVLILLPTVLNFFLPGFNLSNSGVFFAWAKPVPVNISRCRNPRQAYWITAIAGPLANLAQAFVAVIGMAAVVKFGDLENSHVAAYALSGLMLYGVINVMLMVLNLIPIPPLDGSRVLTVLLPREIAYRYVQIERYGFLVLIALINMPFFREFFRRIQIGFIKFISDFLNSI